MTYPPLASCTALNPPTLPDTSDWTLGRVRLWNRRHLDPIAYLRNYLLPNEIPASRWTSIEHRRFLSALMSVQCIPKGHRFAALSVLMPGRTAVEVKRYYNCLGRAGLIHSDGRVRRRISNRAKEGDIIGSPVFLGRILRKFIRVKLQDIDDTLLRLPDESLTYIPESMLDKIYHGTEAHRFCVTVPADAAEKEGHDPSLGMTKNNRKDIAKATLGTNSVSNPNAKSGGSHPSKDRKKIRKKNVRNKNSVNNGDEHRRSKSTHKEHTVTDVVAARKRLFECIEAFAGPTAKKVPDEKRSSVRTVKKTKSASQKASIRKDCNKLSSAVSPARCIGSGYSVGLPRIPRVTSVNQVFCRNKQTHAVGVKRISQLAKPQTQTRNSPQSDRSSAKRVRFAFEAEARPGEHVEEKKDRHDSGSNACHIEQAHAPDERQAAIRRNSQRTASEIARKEQDVLPVVKPFPSSRRRCYPPKNPDELKRRNDEKKSHIAAPGSEVVEGKCGSENEGKAAIGGRERGHSFGYEDTGGKILLPVTTGDNDTSERDHPACKVDAPTRGDVDMQVDLEVRPENSDDKSDDLLSIGGSASNSGSSASEEEVTSCSQQSKRSAPGTSLTGDLREENSSTKSLPLITESTDSDGVPSADNIETSSEVTVTTTANTEGPARSRTCCEYCESESPAYRTGRWFQIVIDRNETEVTHRWHLPRTGATWTRAWAERHWGGCVSEDTLRGMEEGMSLMSTEAESVMTLLKVFEGMVEKSGISLGHVEERARMVRRFQPHYERMSEWVEIGLRDTSAAGIVQQSMMERRGGTQGYGEYEYAVGFVQANHEMRLNDVARSLMVRWRELKRSTMEDLEEMERRQNMELSATNSRSIQF